MRSSDENKTCILIYPCTYYRYGTFAYKALVKLPWVDEDVYMLAKQDQREAANLDKESSRQDRNSIVYNVLDTSDFDADV